jgi:hypothetical protein
MNQGQRFPPHNSDGAYRAADMQQSRFSLDHAAAPAAYPSGAVSISGNYAALPGSATGTGPPGAVPMDSHSQFHDEHIRAQMLRPQSQTQPPGTFAGVQNSASMITSIPIVHPHAGRTFTTVSAPRGQQLAPHMQVQRVPTPVRPVEQRFETSTAQESDIESEEESFASGRHNFEPRSAQGAAVR